MIPAHETPRLSLTNSSRGGTLLYALGRARADIPALLATIHEIRQERNSLKARLDAISDRCDQEQRIRIFNQDSSPLPDWVGEIQKIALGDFQSLSNRKANH